MAKPYQNKIARDLDAIKSTLQKFSVGISAEELLQTAGLDLELRTLQRRLETLVKQGDVIRTGVKSLTRYHVPRYHEYTSMAGEENNAGLSEPPIPLTDKSRRILELLTSPFDQRPQVGYNRKMVEAYRPNKDYYLHSEEREKLANLAKTPDGAEQPAGTYAKQILQRLLIDLSWNSSRLEGNTYSLLDTERLLSRGEAAPEKSEADALMILNHKDAIEFIVSGGEEIGFNSYTIKNVHALLSNNLLPDPAAPGRLRTHAVGIKKSSYTPTAIPQLIEEMFHKILEKASAIENPHEQALFIMLQLPYLQPFEDVNKRVSRLAANIPLNQHNLIPISFVGVPESIYIKGLLGVYELNQVDLLKDVFIWSCIQSADRYGQLRQTIGDPDPFRIKYRNLLRELISEIVSGARSSAKASVIIRQKAIAIPAVDSNKFIEMVETELLSLHDGNFARYRISPAEFKRWRELWESKVVSN